MCNKGRRNHRVVIRIDRREGERENNAFWYIKEMIERELNKAYRIKENASNNKPNQVDPQYKEVDNPTV